MRKINRLSHISSIIFRVIKKKKERRKSFILELVMECSLPPRSFVRSLACSDRVMKFTPQSRAYVYDEKREKKR